MTLKFLCLLKSEIYYILKRTGAISPDSAESSVDESALKKALRKIESFFLIFINPVFLKAFVLTFIAEWGDRSQLSTVVLAVSTVSDCFFIQNFILDSSI